MFCAPEIFFDGSKGVRSRFSCFAILDSFGAVPRVSSPVFMFCAPLIVFDGTEGVWSSYYVLRIFGGIEVVGSRFQVLRFRNRFRRYHGHRFSFSCFALSNTFWALLMVPGPIFIFCALGLVLGANDYVISRFHVFRYRTRFRQY
jgi:hypothetical protein